MFCYTIPDLIVWQKNRACKEFFKDQENGENMKSVSKNNWIAKLGGVVLASFLVLPVQAQLMLAHEGHHSGGDCIIKTGEFHVSMSIYEAMEGGIPPMHAYCDSVPNTGKVSLTIEIPPPARQMMLAVRLVQDGHAGHSGHSAPAVAEPKAAAAPTNEHEGHDGHEGMDHDEHAGHGAAEPGIAYMPPEKHNSGIIVMTANLQEKGSYVVQLEKHEDGNVRTVVRIPISVGKGGGHGSHGGGGFGMMEVVLLLAVAGGGAAFYFMRRKKEVA